MGVEIERKFLPANEDWRELSSGIFYRQGYLYELPEWIGKEVTGDPRYFNASLVKNPFSTWKS